MSLDTPACPVCHAALHLTHEGEFDSWVCPAGHGLAATTSELYHHIEDDEIGTLWAEARVATPAADARSCPICERPMVTVDVSIDADEIPAGADGNGPVLGDAWLDVCLADELVWFDAGEIEEFPADLPAPPVSPEELAKVQQIRDAFGQELIDDEHQRESHEVTERIYRHIARRPGTLHALGEIGSLGRYDDVVKSGADR